MYNMYETPCEFIVRSADILSPIYRNDAVFLNKKKYQRLNSIGFSTAKTICINDILDTIEYLTSDECNLQHYIDSYSDYMATSEISPIICTNRLDWVKNQFKYLHEYENVFYNKHFSIGLIECDASTSKEEWNKFFNFLQVIFADITTKHHGLANFKLYDDSDNDYFMISLDCIRLIDLDIKEPEFERSVTNNPTILYSYRQIYDAAKMEYYIQTHPEEFDELNGSTACVSQYQIYQEKVLDLLNHKDDFKYLSEKFKEITMSIKRAISDSSYYSDSINISGYRIFGSLIACHIIILELIKDVAYESELLDEVYCTINTSIFDIKTKCLDKPGVQSDMTTMMLIYRGTLIHSKDLLKNNI